MFAGVTNRVKFGCPASCAGGVEATYGAGQPMAWPEIHEKVAEILEPLPRGTLLDVPAGQGALSARLREAGFEVKACDLYPELFCAGGIEVKQADLSARLPYAREEFSYVVCIEGLEHIENPHQAIREFARVLKPGGFLIISTPNILNIEERAKWLLYGYSSHFKPISPEHLQLSRSQSGEKEAVTLHINPISYPELRYILEKHGFEVQGLFKDRNKPLLWLYAPLVGLIRLVGWLTPARKKRERWTRELQSDAILLGGNTLIVLAKKK